jgi:hypothetical protein
MHFNEKIKRSQKNRSGGIFVAVTSPKYPRLALRLAE